MDKIKIRSSLREQRQTLSLTTIKFSAEKVAAQVTELPEFQGSHHIGIYLSNEGELDTEPLVTLAHQSNKQIYLPITPKSKGEPLSFYHYTPGDELIPNKYGIYEPNISLQKPIMTNILDIVFLPLVAFDKKCNRIGRGAGHYDSTFAFSKNHALKKTILVGLAYEFQKIPEITPSDWDVPLDYVITELQIYRSNFEKCDG